ncbi:MAG: ATPase, T2SS/T4P/T4SS family [Candidatus Diapherotrites archaeon]
MAKLVESYDLTVEDMKVKVSILEEKDAFVRTYFLELPEYGEGTRALMSSLKSSLIADVAISTERMMDPKFIQNTKDKFRKRAETILQKELSSMDAPTRQMLINMLLEEMLGLGKTEFLLMDGNLEEIVINSAKEPIWVYHKKHGWLKTNIVPESESETQNYASIIARRVGKQITTLNPLLDAHLITGDRANATLFPISGRGNTITIRRFRRDPWTVTDVIENNTANSEVMALIWLCIQYELNILFSGGTASGKTTALNVCLPFIQPNQRVLTIEDSVLPETEIIFEKEGHVARSTVGQLVDEAIGSPEFEDVALENNFGLKLFSMTRDGKIEFVFPSKLYRHKVQKKVLDITTESGKQVSVTADHSLFTLGENGKIESLAGKDVQKGTFLAAPRSLVYVGKPVVFDLSQQLAKFKSAFLRSQSLPLLLEKSKTALRQSMNKNAFHSCKRNQVLRTTLADALCELPEDGVISSKYGTTLPLKIEIDEDLAASVGLWLADGCYDSNSVLFSIVEPECREVVERIAKRYNINVKMHSDGITLMLNSKVFKTFFEEILGLRGNAYTKRIPDWVFSLPEKEAAALLRGYFSGDGWQRKYDAAIRSASLGLLKDTQTLLLRFGVHLRFKPKRLKDKTFEARISEVANLQRFKNAVGFLQPKKMQKLELACARGRHEVSDIIPLSQEDYKRIKRALKSEVGKRYTYNSWKSWQNAYKKGHISRSRLQEIVSAQNLAEYKPISENDLVWEKVASVREREYEGFVYDFSVPENESFVCNNMVCHNTRELTLPDYLHWVPLTTREPNPEGKGEVSMLDLLVNSLRMRPDRIIVGETRRQREAEVMFEAMHTGHSVYTTIHANTADETIRRLTNPPIDIPKSSLDAVHLNVVMFRNRRVGARRILQIAEFIQEKRSEEEERISANILYRWRPSTDTISKHQESIRLNDEISLHTGFSAEELNRDLKDKQKILEWMGKQKIRDIQSVGRVIAEYYLDADTVLKRAEKNQKMEF